MGRLKPIPRFEVWPRRWVVERTFAWLDDYRRLSREKDDDNARVRRSLVARMRELDPIRRRPTRSKRS